jgi:hypothetical protein
MRLGPRFAVLETLGRNNPGFTLQVDFGPFHFARPQCRQQRDFKSSSGNALSLAYCREELRRLLVIKGSLPANLVSAAGRRLRCFLGKACFYVATLASISA